MGLMLDSVALHTDGTAKLGLLKALKSTRRLSQSDFARRQLKICLELCMQV